MNTIVTTGTSRHSAQAQDIVIEEHDMTRRVVRATLNDTKVEVGETVGITIVHQRKKKGDAWEDITTEKLSTLKAGDGYKLQLDSATTKRLYDALAQLYLVSGAQGITWGKKEFTIAEANEIIKVGPKRRQVIESLLAENFGEEVWNELAEKKPDLATKLSLARIQTDRAVALAEFKQSLEENRSDEKYWQSFFLKHQWIFGYGLNYQFLHMLADQPDYGGGNYTGRGSSEGDFLMATTATVKFTVLVEIKTPATRLCSYKSDSIHQHRNGVALLGRELLGGVSQLQVNARRWAEGAQRPGNVLKLHEQGVRTVEPKSVLVIGNTQELAADNDALSTFELFRGQLHNPRVLTFDELYERAQYIVWKGQPPA